MTKTLTFTVSRQDASTILDALQYAALMLSAKPNTGDLAKRATRVQAKLLAVAKPKRV